MEGIEGILVKAKHHQSLVFRTSCLAVPLGRVHHYTVARPAAVAEDCSIASVLSLALK